MKEYRKPLVFLIGFFLMGLVPGFGYTPRFFLSFGLLIVIIIIFIIADRRSPLE